MTKNVGIYKIEVVSFMEISRFSGFKLYLTLIFQLKDYIVIAMEGFAT